MKIRKKNAEPVEEIIHSAVLEDAKAYATGAATVMPATVSATAFAAAASSGFSGPLSRNVASPVLGSPGRLGSPRRSDPVKSEYEHFWTESDLGIHDRPGDGP